jgi:predicted acyltransferase
MPASDRLTTPVRDPLTQAPDGSRRLMSLDVLRGFDMFWIVGGGAMVSALGQAQEGTVLGLIREQLTHVGWAGFRFYDMIFPLFVFIAGVSTVFSLAKAKANGGVGEAMRRVLLRGLLLFLLGVFYSGGIKDGWQGVRWLGVLQRIALSYTGASLLYLALPVRALVAVWVAVLLGYWGVVAGLPVKDIRLERGAMVKLMETTGQTNAVALYNATTNSIRGRAEPGYNYVNHFDFRFLPGRLYDGYSDPEGILSTIPAVMTCVLGVFAGLYLRREDLSQDAKSLSLFLVGLVCVLTGVGWGLYFPVVKKLWTSSFVLLAGGWSLMLLAFFHQVVDVWRIRWWCGPFQWIGMNALTIYIAANLLGTNGGWQGIAARFVGGPVAAWFGGYGKAFIALAGLGVMLGFARFLFKRGIFLRL